MSKKPETKDKFNFIVFALVGFALVLLALVLIKSKTARASIFVTLFIVANMILSSYKRFLKIPIEFEVLTLGIVICTVRFGIKAGLVVAILGGILSFIVGYNISPFSFPMLLGYILIAFTSFILSSLDLFLIGMAATLINNIFVFIVYHFSFRYDLVKNVLFSASNILFNLIFFMNLAPILLSIIN